MTRMERKEQRRARVCIILGTLLLILAAVMWSIWFKNLAKSIEQNIEYQSRGILPVDECETLVLEDPDEPEKIAAAVIAAIGTEREQECFGYNATYVLKVLTAECGEDDTLCWAVSTALFNECKIHGGRISPEEATAEYKWAQPSDFISKAALTYFCKVFVYGELDPTVGDATIFYNPMYTTGTPYHESQEFVVEVNGVRFFREVEE